MARIKRADGRWQSEPAEKRFWEKVSKNGPIPAHRPELGPCWVWTAATTNLGYGKFGTGIGHGVALAHRWAWQAFVGPIPEGLEPDHLCRNPGCVNYERHLELVTHLENCLRGASFSAVNARKTHCPKGHPYDAANTYPGSGGSRKCKACNRERCRARYRARDKS